MESCKFHVSCPLINLGVLQRSILGPSLFIIYVNDLLKCLNTNQTVVFADNTNLFLFDDSSTELYKKANDELHEVDPVLLQTGSLKIQKN